MCGGSCGAIETLNHFGSVTVNVLPLQSAGALHRAVMRFGDPLDDRQPEPEAAILRATRALSAR